MLAKLDLGGDGIRHIAQTVWRRRYMAVAVTLVSFAAGAAIIFSLTPSYSASSLVMLPRTFYGNLGENRSQQESISTEGVVVRSEIELIASNAVCKRVIQELNLQDEEEFQPRDGITSALKGQLALLFPANSS